MPNQRDLSLDAFRGLTVMMMIIVNIQGNGDAAYAAGKYVEGAAMFEKLIMDDVYEEFLTLPAYRAIA